MTIFINIPVINRRLAVLIAKTDAQVYKILLREGVADTDLPAFGHMRGCKGRCQIFSNGLCLIRLNALQHVDDLGTLQHELRHAVDLILDFIGMKPKMDTSDEAYAYLTGYLTTKIYQRLKIKIVPTSSKNT